ncbi:DUF2550 family protein [Micrococcus luteus]
MRGPVPVLVAVAAGVILLLVWLIRRRALMASPGTFPAVATDPRGRRHQVIGRYDDETLRLFHRDSFIVRPAWSAQRCGLDLERVESAGLPETAVRIQVSEADVSFTLDLDEADASGLRAWIEAGPSLASQPWWNSGRL